MGTTRSGKKLKEPRALAEGRTQRMNVTDVLTTAVAAVIVTYPPSLPLAPGPKVHIHCIIIFTLEQTCNVSSLHLQFLTCNVSSLCQHSFLPAMWAAHIGTVSFAGRRCSSVIPGTSPLSCSYHKSLLPGIATLKTQTQEHDDAVWQTLDWLGSQIPGHCAVNIRREVPGDKGNAPCSLWHHMQWTSTHRWKYTSLGTRFVDSPSQNNCFSCPPPQQSFLPPSPMILPTFPSTILPAFPSPQKKNS